MNIDAYRDDTGIGTAITWRTNFQAFVIEKGGEAGEVKEIAALEEMKDAQCLRDI